MTSTLPQQQTAAQSKLSTISQYLTARKAALATIMSGAARIEPDQMIGLLLSEINKSPQLLRCSPDSLYLAVRNAAALGLTFGNGLGQLYLVPFGGRATLMIGYRGMVHVAVRSGAVKSMRAKVVHERDVFDIEEGSSPRIVHKPEVRQDPGEAIGAYCTWVYPDGSTDFVYMRADEVLEIRDKSPASKKGDSPWKAKERTVVEEMWRKTAIRRAFKAISIQTVEQAQDLGRVAEADDGHMPEVVKDADYTERPTASQEPATATDALADVVDPLPPEEPVDEPSEEDMRRHDLLDAINGLDQNDAWKKAISSAQIAHGGVELDALPLDVLEAVYTEAQGR